MAAEIVKTGKFCSRHKLEKLSLPTHVLWSQTANHPPTAHCGFTLIGDQKQTIIQAYTSPGKIAKASYTVRSHSTRSHTITAVKVSKQQPSQPCAFDTQLRATHPLLELSLGCLEMQALTATMRPCSSENLNGHLLANSLRHTIITNAVDYPLPTGS